MDEIEIEERLARLLPADVEGEVATIEPMAQGGSDRRYYRLRAGKSTFIGTYVPDPREGQCFVRLAAGFRKTGRKVPEVVAVSDDVRLYLQEDLGDTSLFSELGGPQSSELVKKTLLELVKLQQTREEIWSSACMARPFGVRQAMWDLNYFKYEYLKPSETIFDEDRLEDDCARLAERLASINKEYWGFMMRDCQSRNVMVTPGGPVFIDFQGGRKGPALYDAVSFLWQARAGFDNEFRMKMLDVYCDAFCHGDERNKAEMLASLGDIVLFRTLQVLGAYGFRGLVQRKAHFLLSIPGALANLKDIVDRGWLDLYPELKRCAEVLTAKAIGSETEDVTGLIVEIYSFSYKKGYPEDLSGNGGGFMFDCRALHNPGRYAQYRRLTGRDEPVIAFLESRGEVQVFLRNVWSLTDAAIERYVARGFTKIQIGFGCTGGQHRSVYSAEQTAAHVRRTFPEVTVRLIHREHPESPKQ